ncbi:MAG: futalosine hydrolase [Nitrospirae bacterium]|nr:futalosine hydrolase [Nitrospirota bacterium]
MIALLCSVQAEADILIASTIVIKRTTLGSKQLIEGTIGAERIILCISGMGKVNAAHTATLMLARFDPEALVVFGIGGAYPSSGARIGDLAIAKEEIAGDEGVLTRDGFKDTAYIGIPLLKTATSRFFSTYPASEPLVHRSLQSLGVHRNSSQGKIHVGSFITLSTCTGTTTRARELEERYHGLCENMEGAAVAHVAELHGVPWLEVRGISNIVEDRDLKKWDIPKAAGAVQQAVQCIVEGWGG